MLISVITPDNNFVKAEVSILDTKTQNVVRIAIVDYHVLGGWLLNEAKNGLKEDIYNVCPAGFINQTKIYSKK